MQRRSGSAKSRGKRTSGMDKQLPSPRPHRDMQPQQRPPLQVDPDMAMIPQVRTSNLPLVLKEASPQCSLKQEDTTECHQEWHLHSLHQVWPLHQACPASHRHNSLASSLHLDITLACQCRQAWRHLLVWHHLLAWCRPVILMAIKL